MPSSATIGGGTTAAARLAAQAAKDILSVARRLGSGKRVASAKDDVAAFSMAQNMRAQAAGLNAIHLGLSRAIGATEIAIAASEAISDILIEMRERALAAVDTSLDSASRALLTHEFEGLLQEIGKVVAQASYDGVNLLDGSRGQGIQVNASVNLQDTIAIGGDDFSGLVASFYGSDAPPAPDPPNGGNNGNGNGNNGNGNGNNGNGNAFGKDKVKKNGGGKGQAPPAGNSSPALPPSTPDDTGSPTGTGLVIGSDTISSIDGYMKSVGSLSASLGSAAGRLETHSTFLSGLTHSLNRGIGSLVDADLAADAAIMQSLQVRQQLSLQGLAMAGAAQQSLLALF